MSIENARDFLERMKTDPEFKKDVSAASNEERQRIIFEAGFDFTDEELEEVGGALGEDELENVAGGVEGALGSCRQQCEGAACSLCHTESSCYAEKCGNQCALACRNVCDNQSCGSHSS